MQPSTGAALPEPFASALAESLACLESDGEVEAVFLGGSLAAGDPTPRSDLDLVVIKADREVILNKAVKVMDIVKAAGAGRLCLATEKGL